jgi:hypothetical protein
MQAQPESQQADPGSAPRPGPNFHRLDRTSLAWRTHNFAHRRWAVFEPRGRLSFVSFLVERYTAYWRRAASYHQRCCIG